MLFQRIQSLLRHTAVYGIGDLAGKSISLLLVPIYARKLLPEDNGVLTLAFAFIGFSAVFYSLGLNPALVRHLSIDRTDRKLQTKIFSTAFWTLTVFGFCVSSILWLGATPVSIYLLGIKTHAELFRLIALILFLDTIAEPMYARCRAHQNSRTYAVIRLCQHTLQLGLTAYLIAIRGQGVSAVFWSNLASSGFAFVFLLPTARKSLRLVYSPEKVKSLFAFGIPFIPSTLAVLVIDLSDRFLIQRFMGLGPLGIYGIVYKIGLPMFLVVRAFRTAWAPSILAVPDRVEALAVCARITTYFAASGIFLFLCISAYSRELIYLIAGPKSSLYLEAEAVVPLITLSYLFYGFYVILTAGVYVESRTRLLPAIVGTGAAVNVGMNIVLIPVLGFIAAAWSTFAAYVIMVIFLYGYVRRIYPVSYEYLRLTKLFAAGTVVYFSMSQAYHDTSVQGITARAIFLLGYPVILWGWGFFKSTEWSQITALFHLSHQRTGGQT